MKFFQKNQKKILAAIALLLVVMMLLPMLINILGSAGAVTQAEIDGLKGDAAALNAEKAELAKQLKALEGEINSALSRKQVVEQEINVVNQQIETTTQLIAQYDELIAQYDVLIAEEEDNLTAAQAREAKYFDEFCRRVRAMSEEGTVSYWHILFNAADFADLLDRVMMLNDMAKYDNAIMDALEQARSDVEEAKSALEESQAEQVAAKEEQVAAKADLETQKAELKNKEATVSLLIQELKDKEDVYQSQMSALDDKIDILKDQIAAKQKQYEEEIRRAQLQYGTGSGYKWPLPGYYTLSSLYGPRPHPITHLPNNHGGIDIPAPYGTQILAARAGVVITSGYNNSYGNYVVVAHGDTNTLYAHMSKRAVSEGQTVAQGQCVGYVGSTGSSTGNHLHFEVRTGSGSSRTDPIDCYPGLNLWVYDNGVAVPLPH